MAFSLYAATVPSFLQIIGSVEKLVQKAEAYVAENALKPEDIIQARLAPDMLPFAYQVKSTAEHSIGAIEAIRVGVVSPSLEVPPDSFSGLFEKLASAQTALHALDPEEINGFVGREMRFEFKQSRMDFTAEGFLTVLRPAQLLLSCNNRVRHSAQPRREDRQDGFPGANRCQAVTSSHMMALGKQIVKRYAS